MHRSSPISSTDKESHKSNVKDYFDGCVTSYVSQRRQQHTFITQQRIVLKLLGTKKGTVLDVGCGPGVMMPELVERGYDAYGIDLSEDMIEGAMDNSGPGGSASRASFAVGDIENLGFADSSFDAIICMGVFEYLTSYDYAIAEIHRTLKPGGVVIITVPNRLSAYHIGVAANPCQWAKKLAPKRLRRSRDAASDPPLNRCISWRLDRQLRRRDLLKVACRHCNFIFYPLAGRNPVLTEKLDKALSRFYDAPVLKWFTRQYIVKCRKPT